MKWKSWNKIELHIFKSSAIWQDFGHPKNRCRHTQLNVCEKEEFSCFLYLIQILVSYLFDLTYKTRSERSCLLATNWRLFRFLKMSTNKIRVLKMNGRLLLKTRVISCVKCEPRQGSWKCLIVGMKIASRTAVVMTI